MKYVLSDMTCMVVCAKKAMTRAEEDLKLEYTRALVFSSLCYLAHRDMIREGDDGIAINRDWRLRVVELFDRNHKNYFAICHSLLAGNIYYKFTFDSVQ